MIVASFLKTLIHKLGATLSYMRDLVNKYISWVAWGLALAVSVVAVVSWAQHKSWQLTGLSSYEIFPVFGLLAFSLMWCHYIVGGIKAGFNIQDTKVDKRYFAVTAAVVLAALLIHPTLLLFQLWRDGFGLPPGSYKAYVAPGAIWAVYLGTVCWLAFMAFELRHWCSEKKWWKYVTYANDIAIWGIYIHGLKLGADVAAPWLAQVWIFYGLALAAAFVATYSKKFAKSVS